MHLPHASHLRPVDLLLVAVYLAGITLFGLRFRKGGERSLRSYFLADRNVPWWAIALSIVSAETSTLTIISVPGLAFTGDFGFLQIALGYLLGRIVICILFLPRYFRGDLLTAYQLIGQRFGGRLQRLTAVLFLIMRAAAEGVRVFAVAIVVGVSLGTGDVTSIAILSALTLLYTFEGGMAAVIWTDVVQMILYVVGSLTALWTLCHKIPGGWNTLIAGLFCGAQAHRAPLLLVHRADLYLPGRSHRRLLPYHGQPRNRSAYGAAPARREKPARFDRCAALQRRHRLLPVHALPAHRRGTLCLLSPSRRGPCIECRPAFPGIHRERNADRNCGPDDRRHARRGDVQPQRRAQLALRRPRWSISTRPGIPKPAISARRVSRAS